MGVILVGLACLCGHDHPEEPSHREPGDIIYGIILLQFGILCGAIGFIVEEKFMRNHKDLDPIFIVGSEGFSGTFMWALILPLFYFIPCTSVTFCTNGSLEDTPGAWEDYQANANLIY